ncbi:MAG: hypothetical protein ACTS73_00145 [Arsenophonus sp. NEOnobi-MAG3]
MENLSAIIRVDSVGLAALVTFWVEIDFGINNPDDGYLYHQIL